VGSSLSLESDLLSDSAAFLLNSFTEKFGREFVNLLFEDDERVASRWGKLLLLLNLLELGRRQCENRLFWLRKLNRRLF
jgi:hypothetical protein